MEEAMTQDEGKSAEKKPYASPQLVVYGDIRLVTETKARTGADGGTSVGATFSA